MRIMLDETLMPDRKLLKGEFQIFAGTGKKRDILRIFVF